MEISALQKARAAYQPKLPQALKGPVVAVEGAPTQSVGNQEEIKAMFPNTYGMPVITFKAGEAKPLQPFNVGIILSGGQAPGGHNVISGLYDGVKSLNPNSKLYGFLMGPGGLVDHKYVEFTDEFIDSYRNTGGFDIIGSGRTKLEEVSQFESGIQILRKLDIKALVIIGGDDSNTNACVLAEYYAAKNYGVQVIGCPKTIDGDLKNEQIETSFGFDTACKTYSELIGNIQRDCNSARKYWHFIKLMGRSASHIALECALQTQPNACLISEEVEQKAMSLDDVVTYIAQIVADRAADGNNFGTILIPEGLIEFIPAIKKLIAELNDVRFTIASDVKNPLCGAQGAAHVFAPQKGASPEMAERLDARARKFAEVSAKHFGYDCSNDEGAGAAGGLGYAFLQYLHATCRPGIEVLLEAARFSEVVKDADLVITGEGSADSQTLMGKLPVGVLQQSGDVPVCLIAGRCGFFVFRNHPNHLSVLIQAPMEKRVARVVAKKNISEAEAREIIAKVDTMRENYVKRFTGTTRYDSRNYDLVINAAGKSEEKIADQILAYLEM